MILYPAPTIDDSELRIVGIHPDDKHHICIGPRTEENRAAFKAAGLIVIGCYVETARLLTKEAIL